MANLFSSQKPPSPKPPSPKPPPAPTNSQPSVHSQTVKKDFYNTAFLPKIGNVDGSWWDPAYYMFYFTLVLILINTIYINIKTYKNILGFLGNNISLNTSPSVINLIKYFGIFNIKSRQKILCCSKYFKL